ncbi:ATP-dependent DNA helicase RecG [Candidatus Nomurabacteria bacterium]|nr:ATP-dependent DNA helicase RecG [Candidatus Nomurabacteria bacterium]
MLKNQSNSLSLDNPISDLPMIGSIQANKLKRLNIERIKDLLYHFPTGYSDTRNIISIEELFKEGAGTIRATVKEIRNNYTRSRKVITKAVVTDTTGDITIVWFNQSYITKVIRPGDTFLFQLKLPKNSYARNFYCTSYEKVLQEQAHLGRLTPQYDQTAGVSSKWLRARLKYLRPHIAQLIQDPLNEKIRNEYDLIELSKALTMIHFPETENDIVKARDRLGFDEMLELALRLETRKKSLKNKKAFPILTSDKIVNEIKKQLQFRLTSDQESAVVEILSDMKSETPMNRLLNGDVGSGKTIVSIIATYAAIKSGHSVIVMAPTTILANQHYKSFNEILEPLQINVQLLTSGMMLEPISGPQVIIGTHALLYEKYIPENIGLYIVDEQHRFGVEQREQLKEGEGATSPHYLTMTATPIPRTLTNVIYGDKEVSLIQEMPQNRIDIQTKLLTGKKRTACLNWIHLQILEHPKENQAYIILPLVEESEKSDLKAAIQVYEELSQGTFKDLKVGLLHGRMKDKEKQSVISRFKKQKIDVLVATTVVEVGIDVSSASIMLIEHAEKFGLAQLHQLRGRVGRGDKPSFCFVIPSDGVEQTEQVQNRLQFFSQNSSGFKVAEYDLSQRGPGEVYGTMQSGIPSMKIADITDIKLFKKARLLASHIILGK